MELRDLKVNSHDSDTMHYQIAEIIQEKSNNTVLNNVAT